MYVSDTDIAFYSSAVEEIIERIAIADDLVKYGGLSSFPVEDTSVMIISGVKEWLVSVDGEKWLNTLGYYRYDSPLMVSGYQGFSFFCPVCSGTHFSTNMFTCEKCGKSVCNCCGVQVDNLYGIVWCNSCVQTSL